MATRASSTTATSKKLRDSCTACAASKVKCTKEKPACTRCARRGITCEYTASKRTGRTSQYASKHAANRRAQSATEVQDSKIGLPQHVPSYFPDGMISPTKLSPSSISPSSIPRHLSDASLYLPAPGLQDPQIGWCSAEQPILPTSDIGSIQPILTPGAAESEMVDLFTSLTSFPIPDGSESDLYLSQANSDQSSIDLNAFDRFSVSGSLSTGITSDTSVSNSYGNLSTQGITPDSLTTQQCSRGETSDCCLTAALGFLTQLFPRSSTCALASSHSAVANIPTIDSVISENKNITEALTNMLDCPCSYDDYLMTLLSLVVLKVIAWYGAAARSASPEKDQWNGSSNAQSRRDSQQQSYPEQVVHFPTIVGSYCVDMSDQVRMAAQLVLSELHRVQRLVNLLVKRFEGIRQRRASQSSEAFGNDSDSGFNHTSPFSVPTFEHLEHDLRVRLRAVHSETIDLVRNGN